MSPSYRPPPPELVKQLEESRRHAETSLKEGQTACIAEDDDYTGLDLAGAVLNGAMLHEANLSHCRLDDAWFNGAWAAGARFEGASLLRAKFIKAQLDGSNFSGASGAWADFTKVEMHDARLDGADFEGARFFKALCSKGSFRNARLDECNLTRASLREADLTGASLDGANLTEAFVESANFTGAFFTGATRLQGCHDLERAVVDRLFFNKAPLEGDAAREALKSLTSPNVYDLLEPRERQLRLMLDCLKAARHSEATLRETSDSLLSLLGALEGMERSWRDDVASHVATLGAASLAARDALLNHIEEGRSRIVLATLDTLEALVRSPRR
jgi:uncharacterized protein YjbI with pentapeptide repeats